MAAVERHGASCCIESVREYRKIAHSHKPALHPTLNLGAKYGAGQLQESARMYLKKVDGPRAVTLPDGTVMTRADLPDASTRRWVASRKAAVVRAIAGGLIRRDEALQIYGLSSEELEAWQSAVDRHGEAALKATSIQRYRQL